MLVSTLCSNPDSLIPSIFYDSLPMVCPIESCRYPIQITEVLTKTSCTNPRCPGRVTQRLVTLANSLGVKDLGVARAGKFVERFNIKNPMLIFRYEPDIDGSIDERISIELCNKIVNQFQQRKSMTLTEYVSYSNLPHIQTSAVAIFGYYDDLERAYLDITSGGLDWVRQKLSIIKDGDVSLRALNVYSSLMTYKEDLLNTVKDVNIIRTNTGGVRKITAVCSDRVGHSFATKAEFYSVVNNLDSRVHVEFLNAFKSDIDYLIWAGADGTPARYTPKVQKTEKHNSKVGMKQIPIVTASQFIDIIKDISKEM